MDRNQTLLRNDPSYITNFRQLCLDLGIGLKISPPNHQEYNGIPEKSGGRDVSEHVTALLLHSGISLKFWPFAVQHYVDCLNVVVRPNFSNTAETPKSPYFREYEVAPYLGHFRVFGCPAFLFKDKAARGSNAAFSSRVDRCIHLGVERHSPPGTYLLYKLLTKQLVVSRDVIFDEHFRFVTRSPNGWTFDLDRLDNDFDTTLGVPIGCELISSETDEAPTTPPLIPTVPAAIPSHATSPTTTGDSPVESTPSTPDDSTAESTTETIADTALNASSPISDDSSPRPSRSRQPPSRFTYSHPDAWETVPASVLNAETPPSPSVQASMSAAVTVDPTDVQLTPSATTATPPTDDRPPPMTAHLEPDWTKCDKEFQDFAAQHGLEKAQNSYRKEMQGIVDAGVLSVPMELPPNKEALSTKILNKEKPADGTLKSRFICRGCHQTHGQDYDNEALYAPVAHRVSIRMLLAIAAALCCFIHTVDVTLAFLYGDLLKDHIYIRPPPGFTFGTNALGRKLVCKLRKSLYGLKQAPRIWHGVIHAFICSLGFTCLSGEECIFFKISGSPGSSGSSGNSTSEKIVFFIALYVDDVLLISNSLPALQEFEKAIMDRFKVKDLGPINNGVYLGIEIQHDQANGIVALYCDSFIKRSLEKLGISPDDLYPTPTPALKDPLDLKTLRVPRQSNVIDIVRKNLRQITGILVYAVTTCRPDLAVAASLLSSTKWDNITDTDVNIGVRSIQYLIGTLKRTPKLGVRYNRTVFSNTDDALKLLCYADSDFAGDNSTCRSRSGHAIFLANSVIFWTSKLQPTVSLSSTAAEMTSLPELCRELVWIANMLNQLGFPQRLVPVFEDNKAAITLTYRMNVTHRTRHMHIRDLWVRELVQTDLCRILYCSTLQIIADAFTKVSLPGSLSSFHSDYHRLQRHAPYRTRYLRRLSLQRQTRRRLNIQSPFYKSRG